MDMPVHSTCTGTTRRWWGGESWQSRGNPIRRGSGRHSSWMSTLAATHVISQRAGAVSRLQPNIDAGRSYDLLDAIPSPVYVWRRAPDGAIRLAFANMAAHQETSGRVRDLLGGALD